jgi:putative serine protease PepD
LVADVVAGSAAADAGIEVGDVVVAVDDTPISGQAALVATIRTLSPGDEVVVSLVRDGTPLEVTATLGERRPGQ